MQRITGMNHCFQTLNATDFLFSSLSMFFCFCFVVVGFYLFNTFNTCRPLNGKLLQIHFSNIAWHPNGFWCCCLDRMFTVVQGIDWRSIVTYWFLACVF